MRVQGPRDLIRNISSREDFIDAIKSFPERVTRPEKSAGLAAMAKEFEPGKEFLEFWLKKQDLENQLLTCLSQDTAEKNLKAIISEAYEITFKLDQVEKKLGEKRGELSIFMSYKNSLGYQSFNKFYRIEKIKPQIAKYKEGEYDFKKRQAALAQYKQENKTLSLVLTILKGCRDTAIAFPNMQAKLDEINTLIPYDTSLDDQDKKKIEKISKYLGTYLPCLDLEKLKKPHLVAAELLKLDPEHCERFSKRYTLMKYAFMFSAPDAIVDHILNHHPCDDYNEPVNIEGLEGDLQPAYSINGVKTKLRKEDWFGLAMNNIFPGTGRKDETIFLESSLRNINDIAAYDCENGDAELSNHPFGLGAWSEFRGAVALFRYIEAQDYDCYISDPDVKYKLEGFRDSKAGSFYDSNNVDTWLKVSKKDTKEISYIPLQVKFNPKQLKNIQKKYNYDGLAISGKRLDDLELDIANILKNPRKIIREEVFQELEKSTEKQLIDGLWHEHMGYPAQKARVRS